MSEKNDEINKKKNNEQDWSKVERTQDLVDYVYVKVLRKIWKDKAVDDEMVEYVLAKYEKNWNFKDEIADVILEDLQIKYEKDDKGKRNVDDLQNRVERIKVDLARAIKAKQT
uniref:Uncharacterized protein n=1 Tax=Tanacetum cinerariifolium TaxID=118510 RepID=A0A6L2K6D6_TANCI|nr:hypothetical protein [Tanacetum cinerariifolium]